MDTLIKESLMKSMSYDAYRDMVHNLVEQKSTTGKDKSEAMVNYTMLNDRRMKRWDKTVKITEAQKQKIQQNNNNKTWLVLTESWCGDAAHVIPVLNKMANLNEHIELKLVLRDENDALMDAFLTNGNRSIPKLIEIDSESGEVVATYGPRPSEATKMVMDYKNAHGTLTPEFKEDLQRWYNKNKGQTVISDLLKMM